MVFLLPFSSCFGSLLSSLLNIRHNYKVLNIIELHWTMNCKFESDDAGIQPDVLYVVFFYNLFHAVYLAMVCFKAGPMEKY